MTIIQKEVCDNCGDDDNFDEELFVCQLCKDKSAILCEDCMTEHLSNEHKDEIVERFIEESFDDVTKKHIS